MGHKLDRLRTSILLSRIIDNEVGIIVDDLMEKFDKEIIPFEDPEDPARPSLFRDEFRRFLERTTKDNITIKSSEVGSKTRREVSLEVIVGVGDESKMGFGEQLDEETTDGLKIIGTIIQGISGEWKMLSAEEAGERVGRFGKLVIIPAIQYDKEAPKKGWPPKPIWKFSNFPGIPDFFDIDFSVVVDRITKNLAEALKK